MQKDSLNRDSLFNWPELRLKKEDRLCQHAKVIWMCGLSGAGKSTLAANLDAMLYQYGFLSQVIDGDIVRSGLNKGLGFSADDRRENLRRVAELARLFIGCGVITIVSFISPTHESRQAAQSIIGERDFVEVYVNAPLSVCEQRDAKGLYKQAREGLLKNFTGVDSPFEVPEKPDVEINTYLYSAEECATKLLDVILPLVKHND
jgi:adenylylsulfate kinase